jgi:hypothetical protein
MEWPNRRRAKQSGSAEVRIEFGLLISQCKTDAISKSDIQRMADGTSSYCLNIQFLSRHDCVWNSQLIISHYVKMYMN